MIQDGTQDFYNQQAELARQYRLQRPPTTMSATENIAASAQPESAESQNHQQTGAPAQAMPDLTALTERGAVAWAGVDAQGLREGRWYMVTHDGVATLCEDRKDAEKEAKDADMAWPHSGPHRAVQLVEASMAGFTAADMATASAQGFRDGVASLAANAGGEPVAVVGSNFALYWAGSGPIAPIVEKHGIKVGSPLYAHPSHISRGVEHG